MSKYFALALLSLAVLLQSCKKDDDDSGVQIRQLWPTGSYPVPSPVDSRVLFMQEEEPAGLYVLDGNQATLLNASGPSARPDYTWSRDGTRIAFSSPENEIWISNPNDLDNFAQLGITGSHPRFYPVESYLVYAGPEDESENEGIWQYDLVGDGDPIRLSERGVKPEVSPDGFRIAYLLGAGTSEGRTLVVYHRDSHVSDTIAVKVIAHSWLGDSQTLVYETVQNGVQEVNIVRPGDGLQGITIASGTAPAGASSSNDFVFTAIAGDRIDGIFRASVTSVPERLTTIGTNARPAGPNRVVAQHTNGLIEITF